METYGVVFQRSPKPTQVVGYRYPSGNSLGACEEVYRLPVDEATYKRAVRQQKRIGGTNEEKQMRLFVSFKPK